MENDIPPWFNRFLRGRVQQRINDEVSGNIEEQIDKTIQQKVKNGTLLDNVSDEDIYDYIIDKTSDRIVEKITQKIEIEELQDEVVNEIVQDIKEQVDGYASKVRKKQFQEVDETTDSQQTTLADYAEELNYPSEDHVRLYHKLGYPISYRLNTDDVPTVGDSITVQGKRATVLNKKRKFVDDFSYYRLEIEFVSS